MAYLTKPELRKQMAQKTAGFHDAAVENVLFNLIFENFIFVRPETPSKVGPSDVSLNLRQSPSLRTFCSFWAY